MFKKIPLLNKFLLTNNMNNNKQKTNTATGEQPCQPLALSKPEKDDKPPLQVTLLPAECEKRQEINTTEDANNNNADASPLNNESHKMRRRSQLVRQEQVKSNCINNNEDSEELALGAVSTTNVRSLIGVHENEDWQILEAEVESEQSTEVASNPTFTGNSNTKSIIKMATECDSGSARVAPTDKKYIDIDPLAPHKTRYSAAIIHLCAAAYAVLPVVSTLTLVALLALAFTRFFLIPLLYFAYVFWDRQTCNRGGRRIDSVFRSKFWSYLAAYFPIKLRYSTTFKLDPSQNYILNFSPHGIAAFGSVTAFATNGLNFSELFPGIQARFMVHETSFLIPVMREVFSFRGDCSVNSKSIDHMLTKRSSGNLLAIVVGGLAEAELSDSETLKVVVAERKGFVKKALVHGAHLVPCIAFGENSVFKKVTLPCDSLVYRLQERFYQLFKFKHPIYYGRNLVSEKLKGLMPYRRPITVLLGDPIKVRRNETPSQLDIDHLHARYIQQLKEMYAANKDLCIKFDTKLELV